ncbi:hypothetical protein A2645_00745 [Candidatus Nomurabacteria bacterium RIFCSPHIGHO2_01_FULL_39_9]|uniref:Uncharacterized protein n=1 Tax=Candidatus Nomurabacteria bacterium RIFCSPHIGHO2_01_FULL_39_9 TaxID=1801735 RepID=A0A1F6UVJ4_9BACT|nr:MAG: hypothetical protein A2645_00745 [Candidatus Nomurabacteria bacterium RIFCSPHIGHO2_01_FULL_39_9]
MKFNFEKIGEKVEKNIRKATLIGATVLSTLPAFTQEKTTEDQKTISIESAQNLTQSIFEEDSLILKKPSKHPGIYEQYLKDESLQNVLKYIASH